MEKEQSSTCGNATKGTAEGAEKNRGRKSNTCDHAMRSISRRVKEKPGTHLMMESTGTLWREHP